MSVSIDLTPETEQEPKQELTHRPPCRCWPRTFPWVPRPTSKGDSDEEVRRSSITSWTWPPRYRRPYTANSSPKRPRRRQSRVSTQEEEEEEEGDAGPWRSSSPPGPSTAAAKGPAAAAAAPDVCRTGKRPPSESDTGQRTAGRTPPYTRRPTLGAVRGRVGRCPAGSTPGETVRGSLDDPRAAVALLHEKGVDIQEAKLRTAVALLHEKGMDIQETDLDIQETGLDI